MKTKSSLDPKAREILRSWGPNETPTGQVTGGDIRPGEYRALAILGWIEKKPGDLPRVGIQTVVLRLNEDKHIGAVTIGLPVSPRTELYVNAFLQTLGWDGRVWPYDNDKKWPEGSDDEEQVTGLLKRVGLSSTLTFPSNPDQGAPAVRIHIAKSHGAFAIAPTEEVDSPPVHLERFRALVADHSVFQPEKDLPTGAIYLPS